MSGTGRSVVGWFPLPVVTVLVEGGTGVLVAFS